MARASTPKTLPVLREDFLDLKIRVKTEEEESPVPLQQDIRMIDYLQEFEAFIGKKGLTEKQREFALARDRKSSRP